MGQFDSTIIQCNGHDGKPINNYFFSYNKDSLCVLSFPCSALNFRHIDSVLIVFHTQKIFCCCQSQNGFSPVLAASNNGHTEVVDLLVQAGADIHMATTGKVQLC